MCDVPDSFSPSDKMEFNLVYDRLCPSRTDWGTHECMNGAWLQDPVAVDTG